MTAIKNFEYEGQVIEFELASKNIMVNATEMAKIFGKRLDVFLKTEPTKDFLEALKFPPQGVNLGIKKHEEIIQTRGRSGTWMHRILALKFAAWLDPKFEVWVYATIDRLLFGDLEVMVKEKTELEIELEESLARMMNTEEYRFHEELKRKKKEIDRGIAKQQKDQLDLFK